MPGASYTGPAGAPDLAREAQLREDVTALAGGLGERNLINAPQALERTAAWLAERLTGLNYEVHREPVQVGPHTVHNLVVERPGRSRPQEVLVLGAHYDTAPGTPGADDNGSGVAVLLSMAEHFATRGPERTVRMVFFVNEEPPFFRTEQMGSEVSAKAARARGDDVVAMISFETLGYFSDAPSSQHYPWPFSVVYPSTGNFVAFVGDADSRDLVARSVEVFRQHAKVPSEGAAIPGFIEGVDWSDHGPYWRQGYRALMVTDTAPFRNPHYHQPTDLPAEVDTRRLALTVEGLFAVVDVLSEE